MTLRLVPAVALAVLLASCEIGPDYIRPSAPVPTQYKEAKGWRVATPRQAAANQNWWSVYDDPVLDGLERQVAISNQNLKQAEAAYRVAVSLVQQAEAQLYPTASVSGSAQRSGQFGHRTTPTGTSGSLGTQNQFQLTGNVSWTLDIWGKIRRQIASQEASAQASAADLAAARLSAQTTLAVDYFTLRATDEQKRLLDTAVVAFTESLKITQNQYAVGNAARSAVLQAKTQVEQTQSQAIATGVARSQLEHAIAATHTGYFKAGVMTQDLIWEQYPYPVALKTLLEGNSMAMIFDATPVTPITPPQPPRDDVWINKTGSTNGFGAYVAFIPKKRLGIVLLANKNFPIDERVTVAYKILTSLADDAPARDLP